MSIENYSKRVINVLKTCDYSVRSSSPSKISLKPNCCFNIPPGPKFSCPGATKACEGCYAMKGRFVFSSVIRREGSNWKALKKVGYNEDRIFNYLNNAVPKDATVYRIHGSGDFHSQAYINAWLRVIKNHPDTKFWAFTRSFNFDYSKLVRLQNFNLLASTDKFNEKQAKQFVKRYSKSHVRHAFGPWKKEDSVPENTMPCPTTTGKLVIDGACEQCKFCINKKQTKNVLFYKH